MGKSGNTSCKGSSYIRINQSHLCCFIVIFIMHILNQVQSIDIKLCQPVHHLIIFSNHFVIIQIFRCNRLIVRSYLFSGLQINTAIDSIKQAFGQVRSCSEELHFFSGLCRRHTAADGIIIPPYRLHHIVILILNRTGTDGNISRIVLEMLRQGRGIQYGQVWFR